MDAPRDDLSRALAAPAVLRQDDEDAGSARVLFGEFARFNEWTEINSIWEGQFMERIAPGAFDRALAEDLGRVKVLYDHGQDPSIGNKPLGTIRSVEPTRTGMAYEVELIDTDYNERFIEPAARAGLLGASFRFSVRSDDWVEPTRATKSNPERLPERTLTSLKLLEFGPVSFPAYENATAGMRSTTDQWLLSLMGDPERLILLAEEASLGRARRTLEAAKQVAVVAPVAPVADKQPGVTVDSARLALLNVSR